MTDRNHIQVCSNVRLDHLAKPAFFDFLFAPAGYLTPWARRIAYPRADQGANQQSGPAVRSQA
jgi:hypothetical protein